MQKIEARPTCEITGNFCGTDTWGENEPCHCKSCAKWLYGQLQNVISERDQATTMIGKLKDALRRSHDVLAYLYGANIREAKEEALEAQQHAIRWMNEYGSNCGLAG